MSNNPCANHRWYYASYRGRDIKMAEGLKAKSHEHGRRPKRLNRKFKHPTRRD